MTRTIVILLLTTLIAACAAPVRPAQQPSIANTKPDDAKGGDTSSMPTWAHTSSDMPQSTIDEGAISIANQKAAAGIPLTKQEFDASIDAQIRKAQASPVPEPNHSLIINFLKETKVNGDWNADMNGGVMPRYQSQDSLKAEQDEMTEQNHIRAILAQHDLEVLEDGPDPHTAEMEDWYYGPQGPGR